MQVQHCFRKSVLDKVGLTNDDMKLCGDWFLWLKILQASDVAYTSEHLNYFRKHDATTRSQYSEDHMAMIEEYDVLRDVVENFDVAGTIVHKRLDDLCHASASRIVHSGKHNEIEKLYVISRFIPQVNKYDRLVALRAIKALSQIYGRRLSRTARRSMSLGLL